MLFYPDIFLRRVQDITPALLRQHGIRGLILDIDNTLSTHGHPVPADGVERWVEELRADGIALIILSNNNNSRVSAFAGLLDLPYIAGGRKPLRSGFSRCVARFGLQKDAVAIVGDQIFTDILGGNLFGCKTILVEWLEAETQWFFRVKRRLERLILGHRKN